MNRDRPTGWLFLGVAVLVLVAVITLRAFQEPEKPKAPPRREIAGPDFVPAGAPTNAPPAPAPRKGAISIDFDVLAAFDYDPEADLIPDDVRALHGKLVELRGVMYYGVDDVDHVSDFYLMPSHLVCCFGTPRANDTVKIDLRPGTETQYVLNYYLIRGKLEVGLIRDEEGNALALYRIPDAEAEVLE